MIDSDTLQEAYDRAFETFRKVKEDKKGEKLALTYAIEEWAKVMHSGYLKATLTNLAEKATMRADIARNMETMVF